MDWKKLLAYITGSVDEGMLLRNEYLAAENRIFRDQIRWLTAWVLQLLVEAEALLPPSRNQE